MGWDYTRGATKAQIVARLAKGYEHKLVGNTLWVLHLQKGNNVTIDPWIGCYLLGSRREDGEIWGWGYKDMSEDMGPYQYSCPLSFLERTPETCAEWRDGVREYHRRRALKPKIGNLIKLAGSTVLLTVVSVKPLIAVTVTGERYKVPRNMLADIHDCDGQAHCPECMEDAARFNRKMATL